jgi:FixJ family two-component response regulator
MIGTVHLVDDDEALRATLAEALQSYGFEAITHESVERFLTSYVPRLPSVILVDMRMPIQSGLDLIKRAREAGILSPIIVLSGESTAPEAVEAIKNGATDFIFKPAPLAKIFTVVEAAMARHFEVSNNRQMAQQFESRFATLTPRERELCPYLARDEKIKTIAAALNISQPTVKIHKSRVLKKLGVASSAELAIKLLKFDPTHLAPEEENS